MLTGGCAAPEAAPIRQQREPYPIAAWYYVRSYVPEPEAQARRALAGDFAHLRSLGFNTIVADAIEDSRRKLLLDVAEQQSIRVILPHLRTMAYIRSGQFDPAVMSEPRSVVSENVQSVGQHPALSMHYLYDAPTMDVGDRLKEMVELYGALDPVHPVFVALSQSPGDLACHADLPVVLWDNFPVAEDARPGELLNRRYETPVTHAEALANLYAQTADRQHWAMIQAIAIPGKVRLPTPAEWNVIYLTALSAGFVDGVVFYRYHTDERADSGLASSNHTMPPERMAAVKEITKTAARWGPMLRQTRLLPDAVRRENDRVRAVLFAGAKRRFLLVLNPDVETFAHDTVYVPPVVGGRPVARAVNVDETKRFLPAGAERGIAIKCRLRPGEGRLLELFGP